MTKPTKPSVIIPASFAIDGVKTEFNNTKIQNGFDRLQPDVLAGDNLNKLIDDNCKVNNYALDLGDYVDEVKAEVDEKLNKQQITNCILEAPNGVATFSGNTITAKAGLKVLIPNGRNADGTLKNIEYTFPNDIIFDTSSALVVGGTASFLLYDYTDNVLSFSGKSYFVSDETPTFQTSSLWFDTKNNVMNKSYGGSSTWYDVNHQYVVLGVILTDTSGHFTSIKPYNPISILKQSDKSEISGWGMPSNRYIDLTLGASGTVYTAPANGWVAFGKTPTAVGQYLTLRNMVCELKITTQAAISTGTLRAFLPVRTNDNFTVAYTVNGVTENFRFIYAEGEV